MLGQLTQRRARLRVTQRELWLIGVAFLGLARQRISLKARPGLRGLQDAVRQGPDFASVADWRSGLQSFCRGFAGNDFFTAVFADKSPAALLPTIIRDVIGDLDTVPPA